MQVSPLLISPREMCTDDECNNETIRKLQQSRAEPPPSPHFEGQASALELIDSKFIW